MTCSDFCRCCGTACDDTSPGADNRTDFGTRWNSAASEDELRLSEEIEQMKVALESKRAPLYALLAQRAPINRIPDDILSEIFEYNAEELRPSQSADFVIRTGRRERQKALVAPRPPGQIAYSYVCRRWSRVVSSTGTLWTRYHVTCARSFAYAINSSDKHDVPFALRLRITCVDIDDDNGFLTRLAEWISTSGDRLHTIDLSVCLHVASVVLSSFKGTTVFLDIPFDDEEFYLLKTVAPEVWRSSGMSCPSLPERSSRTPTTQLQTYTNVSRLCLRWLVSGSPKRLFQLLRAFPSLINLRIGPPIPRLERDDRSGLDCKCAVPFRGILPPRNPNPDAASTSDYSEMSPRPMLEELSISRTRSEQSAVTALLERIPSVTKSSLYYEMVIVFGLEQLSKSPNRPRTLLPNLLVLMLYQHPLPDGPGPRERISNEVHQNLLQWAASRQESGEPPITIRCSPSMSIKQMQSFGGWVTIENVAARRGQWSTGDEEE